MLQLTPQSRIFLAVHPVDFRKGIDGLAALCRHTLQENPLGGAVYVFRHRTGTTLKLLAYDGQGVWLCTNYLSSSYTSFGARRGFCGPCGFQGRRAVGKAVPATAMFLR
jgi:IS66 Orf2 like protein